MSEKRFKIVVTEIALEEHLTQRQWVEGGDDPNERGYGYTPQVPEKRWVEREVYKQNTDGLDLKAVISAVNGV